MGARARAGGGKRAEARIPEEVGFKTKPELALEMLASLPRDTTKKRLVRLLKERYRTEQ